MIRAHKWNFRLAPGRSILQKGKNNFTYIAARELLGLDGRFVAKMLCRVFIRVLLNCLSWILSASFKVTLDCLCHNTCNWLFDIMVWFESHSAYIHLAVPKRCQSSLLQIVFSRFEIRKRRKFSPVIPVTSKAWAVTRSVTACMSAGICPRLERGDYFYVNHLNQSMMHRAKFRRTIYFVLFNNLDRRQNWGSLSP